MFSPATGLMTIVGDWNRRGVAGPSPAEWTASTLRRALLSSQVAGLREHGVDPSGRTLGQLRPAVWKEAIDRPTLDQVRAVLLNPERNTNAHRPTRYLLTGLIDCGVCGGRLFSRPRDDHTKRYLCAGRRRAIICRSSPCPRAELVAGQVRNLLTTASVRDAMLAHADASDGTSLAVTRAAVGAAQSRLQVLDDDYLRGALTKGRYRSVRVKLEREIDRLTHPSMQSPRGGGSCTPIREASGPTPTSPSGARCSPWWSSPSWWRRDARVWAASTSHGCRLG